jgi:tetratricopeptide (TPR) repeat protein
MNCAEVLLSLYRLKPKGSRDSSMLSRAEEYFHRALQIDPHDAVILAKYADFLMDSKQTERASEYYLRSLEADPNHIYCLRRFGHVMSKRGSVSLADQFYARARAVLPVMNPVKKETEEE